MPGHSINRRRFLRQATAASAVLGAAAVNARAAGANDRISIGVIGAGSRSSAHIGELLGLGDKHNVEIAALCDVWRVNREAAAKRIGAKTGREPRQCARFGDLLAMKDVDAVVIATPDHAHGPILVAALQAGKDVYIEKPMTIDVSSANEALDLARAKRRVVQAGTQYRSDGRYLAAARVIAGGVLGRISRVSVAMNFNQQRWLRDVSDVKPEDVDWEAFLMHLPPRPFDAKLLRCWQLYRETSNGIPGLWMTHYADLVHLLLGVSYPNTAVAHGGIYVWKDGRHHTDTFHALLDYPEGFLFSWSMALGNSAGTHFTLHGTEGTMDLQKWTWSTEGGAGRASDPVKIEPLKGASHIENWLQCLRSRQRPNADIQFGHQHTVATIMAATALETGRRQKYDPARRMIVPG